MCSAHISANKLCNRPCNRTSPFYLSSNTKTPVSILHWSSVFLWRNSLKTCPPFHHQAICCHHRSHQQIKSWEINHLYLLIEFILHKYVLCSPPDAGPSSTGRSLVEPHSPSPWGWQWQSLDNHNVDLVISVWIIWQWMTIGIWQWQSLDNLDGAIYNIWTNVESRHLWMVMIKWQSGYIGQSWCWDWDQYWIWNQLPGMTMTILVQTIGGANRMHIRGSSVQSQIGGREEKRKTRPFSFLCSVHRSQ